MKEHYLMTKRHEQLGRMNENKKAPIEFQTIKILSS